MSRVTDINQRAAERARRQPVFKTGQIPPNPRFWPFPSFSEVALRPCQLAPLQIDHEARDHAAFGLPGRVAEKPRPSPNLLDRLKKRVSVPAAVKSKPATDRHPDEGIT